MNFFFVLGVVGIEMVLFYVSKAIAVATGVNHGATFLLTVVGVIISCGVWAEMRKARHRK